MKWIVLGEDWNSHPSSTQHLFKRVIQQEAVIWVNSIGLRSPKLNLHDMRRVYNKGKSMLLKPKVESENEQAPNLSIEADYHPQVVSPRALPFHQHKWIRYLNSLSLSQQIHSAGQAQYHIQASSNIMESILSNKVLWLSLPAAVDLVGKCDEQLSVYYCGDDFSALAGVDNKTVEKLEAELIEKCDVIFAASPALMKKFPANKTYLLEHGVDYSLFQQPKPVPANFPTGKVMGFYGQLAAWVDIDLLERLADAFPDWTLMLIGKIDTDTKSLLSKTNVRYLPAIAHDELAAYAQHWDLALLPFKHCQQIESCNPLKLREYLATGTRIVSTDFPAAHPYQQHIHLVNKQNDFIETIKQATELAEKLTPEQETARKHAQQCSVIEASWEHKAEEVKSILRFHLNTINFNKQLKKMHEGAS